MLHMYSPRVPPAQGTLASCWAHARRAPPPSAPSRAPSRLSRAQRVARWHPQLRGTPVGREGGEEVIGLRKRDVGGKEGCGRGLWKGCLWEGGLGVRAVEGPPGWLDWSVRGSRSHVPLWRPSRPPTCPDCRYLLGPVWSDLRSAVRRWRQPVVAVVVTARSTACPTTMSAWSWAPCRWVRPRPPTQRKPCAPPLPPSLDALFGREAPQSGSQSRRD